MKRLRLIWEIELPNADESDADLDAAVKEIAESEVPNLLLNAVGESSGVLFGDWTLKRLPDDVGGKSDS